MANTLDSNTFGEHIYNKFPNKYRKDDSEQNYALKRFIFTTADGGFKHIIDDTNGLLNVIDPFSTSKETLYALYEQYGLQMFNGVPEEYMRNFLPHLSEAYNYKGSLVAIDYIATSITGINSSSEIKVNDEDNSVDVIVTLQMTGSLIKYFPDYTQFMRILENFIPFYCTLFVVYNYSYEENNYKFYIGHTFKTFSKLYPTVIETHDPIENINYFTNEVGDLLTFDNINDVIIE